ncbi:MAG: metal ABC transporter ATP-binding protein [Simkaniaceae bacterium]|nr:metal ABC transporter ATP-binding protein [Simkaniaceae bacterium]
MKYAIDIHQLTVNYEKTSALWDINVSVPGGSLVGIIGPNGAGKSTLLKALLGLVTPLSGSVYFFGQPFPKVKDRVAYVPQRGTVDWDFPITVFDVVLMGRYPKLKRLKWYKKADKEAARKILDRLEMGALAARQIRALSGGQQQRLFIARALLQEADILLLDEPFAAVDKATEKIVIRILKNLRDLGKTILVVHHDLKTAHDYFDQALLINTSLVSSGKTKDSLSPDNLARAYGQKGELLGEATHLSTVEKAGLTT